MDTLPGHRRVLLCMLTSIETQEILSEYYEDETFVKNKRMQEAIKELKKLRDDLCD